MTPSVKVHKREPVEPTPRKPFTQAQRKAVLERAQGKCGLCNLEIGDGPFEVDHRKPLELRGAHTLSNWQPMHPRCHKIKTAADMARIVKARHQRAYHDGTKPDSKRPLQGRGFQEPAGEYRWPSRPFPKRNKSPASGRASTPASQDGSEINVLNGKP